MESLRDKIVQLTAEKEEASRNDHDLEQQVAQLVKDKSELQARLSASESFCQSLLEYVLVQLRLRSLKHLFKGK